MRTIVRSALGASAVAMVAVALAFSTVSAAEKKKEKQKEEGLFACNTVQMEALCGLRNDCSWVSAVVDKKTKKEKRKAYCRAKPKTPAKKKT